ncbi:MAG: hypothetical protein A2487_03700 [Candidatus Raymondbacteria bacterium RifOxyC12_full_50_8]|uniref:Glycosyltransferase 2-like domain-containing protein n=1 Tax=Candidatus Raymondbacteria bacterium RIFOXYD12_FULL_49_13 TaxID=1817890 RepID=A0A1F7FKB4_UNCRA|nr:MAG: hypothetical protein A2248_09335 [Candidatus Raymondbacteria bacterium RIFOXYA2_FULL_49_16]OGJ96366.1 MAG: hypothetical protein A2453_08560 [Candidatus Raymondbacteria bacterium RIFOXYC2_FULL_50_21]OGK03178.1 MAG: hypothetical protein A2487_03700 [Candidatus Raymondbacteria bacterium RifOxyC12_full_50_8]OGK06902.1 MAG: hypothetical protein A2519_11625 [Candidatus Raymondbacteria bacterium RIFOXYD12_FULL_49_13]OGP44057.1 MAG: hypothetical protein A2324_14215 [Candidatus Raymondbacteria b
MKTLSVIFIVKNEEARIGAVLGDVKKIADEIIVVDTGSTDRTREIALGAGAKVFNEPWENDFSKARNAALSHATRDWVLWLDADDRLPAEEGLKIKSAIQSAAKTQVFTVEVINAVKDGRPSSFLQMRLFPRSSKLRFEGRIHESIAQTAKDNGFEFCAAEVRVIHTGYETAAMRDEKMQRNLSIIENELEKNPDNIVHRFLLANTFLAFGKRTESLLQYEKIVETREAAGKQADVFVRSLVQLAKGVTDTGRYVKGEEWARKAVAARPGDMEAHYVLARALFLRGQINEAFAEVSRAFDLKPYLSSVTIDFIEIRALLYDMAVRILGLKQKKIEAIELVRKGIEELPYSPEMVNVAAAFFIQMERFDEAESVFRRAALRIPEFSDHFNERIRGLRLLKDRAKDPALINPEYLKMVPAGSESALVVGTGSGVIGLELKRMGVARVYGLVLPGENRNLAVARFDAIVSDPAELGCTGMLFDVILFGDQAVRVRDPGALISKTRVFLKEGGIALFVFPNVQNYTVLSALGYGLWNYGDMGVLRSGMRRLFSRKSAVGFLDEHGFKAKHILECVDPLFSQQVEKTQAKTVNIGKATLDFEGTDLIGMRDFFVIQFIIAAIRKNTIPDIDAASRLSGKVAAERVEELHAQGIALIQQKKYAEASSLYYTILKVNKDDYLSYGNLGLVEWYMGNFEDAYYLFKKSVALQPDYEDGLLNLWDAAQKTNKQDEAKTILEKALAANGGLVEVGKALGR